jgi:NAD(P)H dehydrogenase (quinone)
MSNSGIGVTDKSAPQHLIIFASPNARSFDHAIVDAYAEVVAAHGQGVILRDLYALNFDPVLREWEKPRDEHWVPAPDVARELDYLEAASIIVLVYPIWFGMPPAILKGYVDRVLGANYSFHDMHDRKGQARLAGKPLLSFSTSGLPEAWLRQQEQTDAIRAGLDLYLWRGFAMKQSEHIHLDNVTREISSSDAAAKLMEVREVAKRYCAEFAGTLYGEQPCEA